MATVRDWLVDLVTHNGWAALGAGAILMLYVIGKDEPGDDREDFHRMMQESPKFSTIEDEIAYHEKRLVHLQEIRSERQSNEALLDELLNVMSRLQTDVSELKARDHETD